MELEKRRNLLDIYCCVIGYLKPNGLKQQTFTVSVSVGWEFGSVSLEVSVMSAQPGLPSDEG